MKLRDDQLRDALAVIAAEERGDLPTILCRPTGSGKTLIAAFLMDYWRRLGKRSLFVAERRALVEQASDVLRAEGIPHGVCMAGAPDYPAERIQIASRDTLTERCLKRRSAYLPFADILIRDECHRGMARGDLDLYGQYRAHGNRTFFLGLTATPAMANGRAMGYFWKHLVHNVTMGALIERGLLLGNVIYEPRQATDFGLQATGKEFSLDEETESLVSLAAPIGEVVRDWRRYSEGRPTFVFCTTIAKSKAIAEEFNKHGIAAAHVDLHTESADREQLKARTEAGEIKVVSSCELMGYGVDWPFIGCCVHLRPTRHATPWIQFCGRASRVAGDKKYAIQIDHVGNTRRLGWPEDLDRWDLDEGRHCGGVASASVAQTKLVECACGALKRPAATCPRCGEEPRFYDPPPVAMQAGYLGPARRLVRSHDQRIWDHCLGVAIRRGASVKSAFCHFRQTVGSWPKGLRKLPGWEHADLGAKEWYDAHAKAARASQT